MNIQRLLPSQLDKAIELMNLWYPDRNHGQEHLSTILSKDFIVIVTVEIEGKIIGGATGYIIEMITRPTREMFIYKVGIDETQQNMGYGKKLMKYLISLSAQLGCSEAFVITEEGNRSANALYKSIGGISESTRSYIFGTS